MSEKTVVSGILYDISRAEAEEIFRKRTDLHNAAGAAWKEKAEDEAYCEGRAVAYNAKEKEKALNQGSKPPAPITGADVAKACLKAADDNELAAKQQTTLAGHLADVDVFRLSVDEYSKFANLDQMPARIMPPAVDDIP